MGIQAIYLDREDDVVSIRDRLNAVEETQAILILPDQGDVLVEYIDLVLLQRYADSLRLNLGLVTVDSRVKSQAKALGIPVFPSMQVAVTNKRGWWRGRRKRESFTNMPLMDDDDRREVEKRRAKRPDWLRWVKRYAAISLYILTLALLFIAAAYSLPGATVTLRPVLQPIEVSRQIVADPELGSVDALGASVPGRLLTSIQEWRAEVSTTGFVDEPDSSAIGTAVFVNRIPKPVVVPAGTRISTSGGNRVYFQTLEDVDVPGVVGGLAEAKIRAIEPGSQGNVSASQINRIEGPLALQLSVRNFEPTVGGNTRLEPSVTEADQERLRSQVMQHLQIRALVDMEQQLADGEFLARNSLHIAEILHETYSHFPSERSDTMALEIRAELTATAVDETQAVGLLYEDLAASVPSGYELVPDSLNFTSGEILGSDAQGRVIFEMTGRGLIAASLAIDQLLADVTGQEIGIAKSYLFERLPLRDYPAIDVWPSSFGRLPYLPIRIQATIDTAL